MASGSDRDRNEEARQVIGNNLPAELANASPPVGFLYISSQYSEVSRQ